MISRYLIGAGLTGFVCWLVTFLIALALMARVEGGSGVERAFSAQTLAVLVGGFAFVFPGLIIGAGLWIREVRKRITEETSALYREYWREREAGRAALAEGRATPGQVVEVLHRFHADSVPPELPGGVTVRPRPLRGRWLGAVGERLTISAEVEQVGSVPGREDPGDVYAHYYLHTAEGDIMSWQANQDHGLHVGDVVTIDGQVKSHTSSSTERITEIWYCAILNRLSGASGDQGS